ncbi:hypothetical protein TNCV_1680311 [Trichonephila clavipes]|nr:hypothetical protein TNCV_1680311 [Trichonephila clavipes]
MSDMYIDDVLTFARDLIAAKQLKLASTDQYLKLKVVNDIQHQSMHCGRAAGVVRLHGFSDASQSAYGLASTANP